MKLSLQICLLALCVAVAYTKVKTSDFTDKERWDATLQGIEHAKVYVQNLEKKKAEAASTSKSPAKLLQNFFRKASAKSIAMGMARIKMEEAVMQAERILMEKKRKEVARVASNEEKAEVIADELYHKPGTILGKKELAHIYQFTLCEELRPEPNCADTAFYHSLRSISGVCNNLEHPTQGASFTPFQRILPPRYSDGLFSLFDQSQAPGDAAFLAPFPSARIISDTTIEDRVINSSLLTHLIMQWGQFMDHDLDLAVEFSGIDCNLASCAQNLVCAPVRVPTDDQEFGVGTTNNGLCHPFQRTVPACVENTEAFEPREQVNELTHYIDGSMVYGSTDSRALFLRELQGGRLKVSDGNNLPLQPPCVPTENPLGEVTPGGNQASDCCPDGFDDCFVAGDVRALEHVSLTVIHTIFVREHNRIAGQLSTLNPQWEDERIYVEARDILIAEIQHITFTEYLPALFGQGNFNTFISEYPGYNPEVDASIPNSFATAAYRFGHSQIQPFFERLESNGQSVSAGPLNLRDSFFSPTEFENGGGVDPIVRGWVMQPARALDEFLNSILTSQLFEVNPGDGLDLATLNIQRGRDHGLPNYGTFKRFCANTFGIVSDFRNQLTAVRLRKLYGDPDLSDLFVGALAEEPLPGSQLGSVLTCIFTLTFTRLRSGDRFWYENNDTSLELFTPAQLTEIRKTGLSRILCDNTNIGSVQRNPFFLALPGLFGSLSTPDCGDIPGIDFTPFREVPFCFYRAQVTTQIPTLFSFINRVEDAPGFEQFQETAPQGTKFMCVPFECPGSTNRDIFILVAEARRAACSTPQATPGLPEFFFRRTGITSQDVANDASLFTSLEACLASSNTLVQYQCDAPPIPSFPFAQGKMASTAELENELAKALQTEGGSGDRSSPIKLEHIDRINENVYGGDVRDLINSNPTTASVRKTAQAAHRSGSSAKSTGKEEEKLIDLLQATLQELKHNGK